MITRKVSEDGHVTLYVQGPLALPLALAGLFYAKLSGQLTADKVAEIHEAVENAKKTKRAETPVQRETKNITR